MALEKFLRLVTFSLIFIFQVYLRGKINTFVIRIVFPLVQLILLCNSLVLLRYKANSQL